MNLIILADNEILEYIGMNEEYVDAVSQGFTMLVEGKVNLSLTMRFKRLRKQHSHEILMIRP